MFKRIMSLVLALVVIMSVAMVAASAAEANVDTAADAGADTAASNRLYFEPDTAGWKNFSKMFCHIWVYGGDDLTQWQSKAEACVNKDGKWYYDLDAKKVKLEPGVLYCCIFSNENGMQTYDLLFDSTVVGDSAYCDGTEYENPKDSEKKGLAAFWRGQNKTKFGPVMCITSIGNLVGTCMPSTTNNVEMFEGFINGTSFTSAQTFSKKDDQAIIDDIAKALGLKKKNVEDAVKAAVASGKTIKWDAAKSSLADGEAKPGIPKNENTTQTGQDSTLVFVMFGLMIMALAAVIFVRKRETA